MAQFISLYSGSSGNCSVILCEGKYLLVDMGKSNRITVTALKQLGLALADCQGILVTHEHSDHVNGLKVFLRQNRIPVYGSAETLDALNYMGILSEDNEGRALRRAPEDIGDFVVEMFPTSHDVPCVGYRVTSRDGKVMAMATDLGMLTPTVHKAMSGCDLVVLEANYDPYMLAIGPYPYYLKKRIESSRGHLSNDECAAKVLELVQEGCRNIALCHLSQENNTPDRIKETIAVTLKTAQVELEPGVVIRPLRRNEISPPMEY